MSIPFAPRTTSTMAVSVNTTPSIRQVNAGPGRARYLRLVNIGPNNVFVECTGSNGTTSTSNGMPVPVGTQMLLRAAGSYLATVSDGSATLYVTPGEVG